jgi:hypothetical protein
MSLRFGRRSLIKSLGVTIPAVAAPVLRSSPLLAAAPPVRFVVLFKANGTILDSFWPSGTAANWTIPAGGILEPLMKWKAKLNVLRGVHYDSGDKFVNAAAHQKGPVACLTGGGANTGPFGGGNGNSSGYGNNISVDQYLANKWGNVTALKTLELGVAINGANNRNRISYLGDNQPVAPEPDPARVFARVFSGFMPPKGGGMMTSDMPDPQLLARLAEKKSVLDYVRADLDRLQARLPGDEKARLGQHLESLRDVERQLAPTPGGVVDAACNPTMPMGGDYVANTKAQLDLIFQTLACDRTRLITFIWNGETSQQTFPWLGINDPHHTMSHAGDGDKATHDKLVKVNRWYAEQFAYFVGKMDGVQEANGKTMLDNTVTLWGNHMESGDNHFSQKIPWILAGHAQDGKLKTGQCKGGGEISGAANLCGLPGISVPMGFGKDDLPIGLQINAAPGDERAVLDVAEHFQRATDWHRQRPKGVGDG